MSQYQDLFRLDGRRAVVVGSGGGIGREAARALAAQGAEVVCADRDLAAVTETAELIQGKAIELDVLNLEAVQRAAADLGPVDVLVFTPAINVRKRILDLTGDEFDKVIRLNLRGSFDLVRTFGAGMVERGSGSIIGFASIRAQVTEPGQGVYAATKSGLVQFLRTAAAEFGAHGVRVNAVCPGVVDTPLTQPIKDRPDWYNAYGAKTALGRWAKPDEMAGAVVYLAGDAASYVTGSCIFVDGGWTAIDGRFDPPA